MNYSALIMDIVDSKKLSNASRAELQAFIKHAIEVLNGVFRPSIAFDVIFSAGDELQGLFNNPAAAIMYYRLLKMILAPVQIRCGIGVGDWEIKVENGISTEQDGTAYHNAREAIKRAQKSHGSYVLFNAKSENDIYINSLLNVSCLLMQKQSYNQNQMQFLVELLFPFFDGKSMELTRLDDCGKLIIEKEYLTHYFLARGEKYSLMQNVRQPISVIEPINLFSDSILVNKMALDSTTRKGTATKISEIIKTTRQNIENTMRKADISAIRNVDLTAILFIMKNYGGGI